MLMPASVPVCVKHDVVVGDDHHDGRWLPGVVPLQHRIEERRDVGLCRANERED